MARGGKRETEGVRQRGWIPPLRPSYTVRTGAALRRRAVAAPQTATLRTLTSSSPVATVLTESMLCDNGASMMQASLPDGPGLPGAAVRAGGGDESTVSRLGRFKAGGVMVVPAKTTGASRTYDWKITFPSQETRGPRPPPPLPPPPPPFSPPRLLSFPDLVLLSPLWPVSSFLLPLPSVFFACSLPAFSTFFFLFLFASSRNPDPTHFFFHFLLRLFASATTDHPTTMSPSLHLSHVAATRESWQRNDEK